MERVALAETQIDGLLNPLIENIWDQIIEAESLMLECDNLSLKQFYWERNDAYDHLIRIRGYAVIALRRW